MKNDGHRRATLRGMILCAGAGLVFVGCSSDRDPIQPTDPVSSGACCAGDNCQIDTQAQCAARAGIYLGDDAPCTPTLCNPATPEAFTERGWGQFEQGNFENALADFASAIALDPNFGEAFVGQGWARLASATDAAAMLAAVSSFDGAVIHGETGADVFGGRAAAQLAIGGGSLGDALSDAAVARNTAPTFVFEHRASFDIKDLHLIEAFARAAQANYAAALAAGEQIVDSGIEQGNPATWIVGAETFASFEAAVLAFLHKLSEEHAG